MERKGRLKEKGETEVEGEKGQNEEGEKMEEREEGRKEEDKKAEINLQLCKINVT